MHTETIALDEYVETLDELVERCPDPEDLVAALAPLHRRLIASRSLIAEDFRQGLDRVPYTRNLLHADPSGRYTVMAVVWGPGRETPVHDHKTWGVVGCVENDLVVVDYAADQTDGGALRETARSILSPGDVATLIPPCESNIHKMANPGGSPAVSIHTYGDPARECRVYNPVNGRSSICELVFHHAL